MRSTKHPRILLRRHILPARSLAPTFLTHNPQVSVHGNRHAALNGLGHLHLFHFFRELESPACTETPPLWLVWWAISSFAFCRRILFCDACRGNRQPLKPYAAARRKHNNSINWFLKKSTQGAISWAVATGEPSNFWAATWRSLTAMCLLLVIRRGWLQSSTNCTLMRDMESLYLQFAFFSRRTKRAKANSKYVYCTVQFWRDWTPE